MESKVQNYLSTLGKTKIIELFNSTNAVDASNIIVRKAILDYMESYNKFAYERWLLLGGAPSIQNFFDLCRNCPDYFSMKIVIRRAVIAIGKCEESKQQYRCVTSDIRIGGDGSFIATDITIGKNDEYCFYAEDDIDRIDVVTKKFWKYGNFETIDNGRFAVAKLGDPIQPIGDNAKKIFKQYGVKAR